VGFKHGGYDLAEGSSLWVEHVAPAFHLLNTIEPISITPAFSSIEGHLEAGFSRHQGRETVKG
jgi:hypothetical protein